MGFKPLKKGHEMKKGLQINANTLAAAIATIVMFWVMAEMGYVSTPLEGLILYLVFIIYGHVTDIRDQIVINEQRRSFEQRTRMEAKDEN